MRSIISSRPALFTALLALGIAAFAARARAAGGDPIVERLQEKLASLGLEPGTADGVWGTNTEKALKAYQAQAGLAVTGWLDPETAKRLEIDLAGGNDASADIVDLLEAGKIEIEAGGAGIQGVSVRIRPRVPYPLGVRVPVGTYFVSRNAAAQNMVTTGEGSARLNTPDWVSVHVSAACANRPRDIPGEDDRFSVRRSPQQADLARLMPVIEKAGVGYPVRQAAVWIVTDDADFEDLGALVSQTVGTFIRSRVIDESDTAQAMKLCADAGIDVKRKRIWRDRKSISAALSAGELKKWLEGR